MLLLACAFLGGAAALGHAAGVGAAAPSSAVGATVSTAVVAPADDDSGAAPGAVALAVCETDKTGNPDSNNGGASDFRPRHPDFEPTAEWQEVLDGQPVPPGLDIRFDLEAGKKLAKLPEGGLPSTRKEPSATHINAPPAEEDGDDDDDAGGRVAVVAEPSVVWGTDLEPEPEDAPLPPIVGNLSSTLKHMLLELPEPEPELVAGLRDKLSDEQMEGIYRRVWARRQEEIRQAFKASRDDVKLIKRLLGVLVRGRADQRNATLSAGLAISSADEQLQALVDLECVFRTTCPRLLSILWCFCGHICGCSSYYSLAKNREPRVRSPCVRTHGQSPNRSSNQF
jgi:hypothetical protein